MKKPVIISGLLCLFLLNLMSLNSCHKDANTNDPGKYLRLEDDTLSFDTVFSTIGSATRYLKIYNPHDESIEIDRAYLSNNNQSDFKINADGVYGSEIKATEIYAHDSIYLFCEVTVNPLDPLEKSPFVKMDSVILEYNGNRQVIVLMAWGQNAIYFPDKLNKGKITQVDLLGSTLTWNDEKPYVIYGIVYFDHGTLEIEENTKIHVWGGLTKTQNQNGETYFYNDGRIIIGPDANLIVKGSKEKPVIFQGVRLESSFQHVSGQWSDLYFDKLSSGNEIRYAVIKNNLIGIVADSLSEIKLDEVKIYNNSLYGVYASSANVVLNNCLLYNQGASGVLINTGGNYELNFCTLVNLGNTDPALYLSNARCLDFPFCETIYEAPLKALVRNTVITGSDEDELWMSEKPTSEFKPFVQNCLFRIKDLYKEFPEFTTRFTENCIPYSSFQNLFKDIYNEDFHPDTLSVLEMKAIPLSHISKDLDGQDRDVSLPDIGCYEYYFK